jgi:YHS domain-containing protein
VGILLWIARAILVLLLLRFLFRLLFPLLVRPRNRTAGGRPASTGPLERAGGELVRDPQCGTYVPKSRAIVVERGGATLYFCSAKCRDEYGR